MSNIYYDRVKAAAPLGEYIRNVHLAEWYIIVYINSKSRSVCDIHQLYHYYTHKLYHYYTMMYQTRKGYILQRADGLAPISASSHNSIHANYNKYEAFSLFDYSIEY